MKRGYVSTFIKSLMVGIVGLVTGSRFFNALMDLFSSVPRQVDGMGHKGWRIIRGNVNLRRYYYIVGKMNFEIGQGACAVPVDGLEYRVYYLPHTKTLISIEPLDAS
jgi:hypothetical protein